MPKTLSLLAVLKKIDTKGLKSLSDPQWNTFLASDTEPNEIEEKIKKLEGLERQGFAYDKTGELIVEDSNAMIERFRQRTGRAKGRESLKVKKSKINVKSFKENFLDKDEEPVKPDTTGTSTLTKFQPPAPNPDLSLPEGEEKKEETEGLKGIRDVLDEILGILRLDFKGDRNEARDAQKQAAKDKRKEREGKLEGGGLKKTLGGIGSTLKGIEPINKAWDAIINFLKFTLIGALFNKTMKWFSDPKNQQKAKRIGKFFKDWWPALATAAALFLTPLGGLVKGVVGLLTAIIPKLVMAIAANPWAALALVGTGLAVWGVSKLASGGDDKKQKPVDGEGRESSDGWSDVKAEPNMGTFTGDGFQKEFEGTAGFQEFNEGGLVQSSFTQSNQSNVQNYNEGGLVQSSQSNQRSNVQNYNEGGLVQSSSTQNYNEGGLVQSSQSNQSSNVQNFNEGGLVQSNQSSNVQKFNEGGLVNTYNDQKSAQNFVQNFNEGGLVQNFEGGGSVDDTAIPMIKQHEGLRLNKYNDSMGFPTIGYGHLVEENENISDTITESQADSLFEKDYQDHKKAAMNIPGYDNASVQQKAALIDLTFNMGPGWVDGFPKFKKAFASGNYDVAADELINSNWYSQVNTRGPVIVDLIRDTGGVENNLINSDTTVGGVENNLINSDTTVESHSNDDQSFNEGGLVNTYNDQKSAQNFIQKYNQGGLVQYFKEGGSPQEGDQAVDERGVVTDPEERKQQEAYMLKFVNEERAMQGLEPLTNLTYAPGVELTKMIGPGPRVEETSDTNIDLDRGITTTDKSKTRGDESISSIEMRQSTDEEKEKFFAANPHAAQLVNLKDQSELDNLGTSISASAKMNGGGLVQGFNKGGEVPGSGNKDTVPAMLTPGEFVMSKGAVSKFGTDTLENMNSAAAGPTVSSKKSATVPAMLTPGEFVVSAPAVQKYGVDTMKSMNLKGGGNNKPEIKISANKGGLINNYNTTLMKYKGGGVVEELVEESTEGSLGKQVSRDILDIIKQTGENILAMFESDSQSESTSKTISISESKMNPVETPIPPAKNEVITLPPIRAPQGQGGQQVRGNSDIPDFRIPIVSSQRSMVLTSLGISDLIGG